MAGKKTGPKLEAKKIEALILEALPGETPKSSSGVLSWYPFRDRYESGHEAGPPRGKHALKGVVLSPCRADANAR